MRFCYFFIHRMFYVEIHPAVCLSLISKLWINMPHKQVEVEIEEMQVGEGKMERK